MDLEHKKTHPINPATHKQYMDHAITIANHHFGTKLRRHATDFGLDVTKEHDRNLFKGIILDVFNNATERVYGDWRQQHYPVVFHIKGDIVVVESDSGYFISILKGGTENARVKKARRGKFERFFQIVQEAAQKYDCVFFVDAGDGNELETDELICEDLSGWLIPNAFAEEFEKQWSSLGFDGNDWNKEFFCIAVWEQRDSSIVISFCKWISRASKRFNNI